MKVKITKEIKELEGEVIERPVTPFGTSAHIPFLKKHTGKQVNVIIPEESKYVWVLPSGDLNNLIKLAKAELNKEGEGKLSFYYKQTIENLKDKTFALKDLVITLKIVEKNPKNKKLVKKIERVYNL